MSVIDYISRFIWIVQGCSRAFGGCFSVLYGTAPQAVGMPRLAAGVASDWEETSGS